jgi:hypothetical protein
MAIIHYIGLICFTWLFATGADPIQFIKNFFKVGNDSEPKDITRQLLQKLLNCSMCMGFWFGLIYYQNFLLACVVSISAELFSRLLNYILIKL